jgi:signal transduction histidine kinase
MPHVKLLIVEDEEIVAFDLEDILKSLGYKVSAIVASGEEAIAVCTTIKPDLVLMDIMLKGDMDGTQAAEVIKKHFNIPVIYLTAYGDTRTLDRAKTTEPFGYLVKPFEERELYTAIEIALSRHQAEEKIRLALEKEKELSELKSLFVANASHEFRTPLATIRSSTELLERYSRESMDEKKSKHFQRIQAGIEQMLQLLDDLLIVGKAEAGRLEFNPLPLDLVEFCHDLVEELQLSLGNQQLLNDNVLALEELALSVDEGERTQAKPNHSQAISFISKGQYTTACMDANLLRQILTNLLSNAIKYSPEGAPVIFEVCYQDEVVTFRIQDRGIGISIEDQKQLFEPFYRAGNVGKIKGTGLGLSIAKNCVDLHGGHIAVESQLGIGTTFTVTLPLVRR